MYYLSLKFARTLSNNDYVILFYKLVPSRIKIWCSKVNCYHFSWLGPMTSSTSSADLNLRCEENFKEEEPCFEPLVYTIGKDNENGPNTTIIEEICESTGECNPLCEISGTDMCIKLVYYKSSEGGVDSSHSFCGTVKGVLPIEGCHYQKMKDGMDVQACFCSTDRCNADNKIQAGALEPSLPGF
ncbi:unnamed protein product [Lepeophtheirus salmonis]|uniref:(salmon louse) hypothetical protein n=1 Tax=Lepeophtheirus salmonis TaxID=72036 RepID=A0A7R8CLE2_LEPSM|nr:unnamed protein product [Lepeophtheirus salmonis]CAF2854570.1 unnamed protein product [Lepeophtheirus salmonis]